MFKFVKKSNRGITLLIAVLVTSVIMAIALTILSISFKQFKISSSAKESVLSIYAADAGIECALLWDIRGIELRGEAVFATSTESSYLGGAINCFGTDISSVWSINPNGTAGAITTFQVEFAQAPQNCVIIEVEKIVLTPETALTEMSSKGYNVPCLEINTSPIAVERAIRVKY
jgi:Tfp pilus assembly protein PilX